MDIPAAPGGSSGLDALQAARTRVAAASTADRVADVLREEIAEGRLRAGARLPEQQLGDALAVSRNTVREALGRLVAERVLVREAHRGVFVATPDLASVADLYRARRALEPGAVRLAENADTTAVRAAVTEARAGVAADDGDAVAGANQHFHRALVALAGSTRLDEQMGLLLAEMRLVFHRMPRASDFHRPYVDRNDAVCRLLEADDPAGAATLLAEHLLGAQTELLAALAQDGQD